MITAHGARDKWLEVAKATGTDTRSVPFFAICGKASVGYSSAEVTGQFLLGRLKDCYRSLGGVVADDEGVMATTAGSGSGQPLFGTCSSSSESGTCDSGADSGGSASSDVQPVELPFIGVVTPDQLSLPLLTLVLAGVDAFNPCAFFVLLFLLSIMVNAKSRSRMLIVGGIFVFFSGFIYFLFMTAWLNMFELLGADGDGGTIILAAGLLALVAGTINVKDFFFEKGEVTLSMSAEKRTGLIKTYGQALQRQLHDRHDSRHHSTGHSGQCLRAAVHRRLPDDLYQRAGHARAACCRALFLSGDVQHRLCHSAGADCAGVCHDPWQAQVE